VWKKCRIDHLHQINEILGPIPDHLELAPTSEIILLFVLAMLSNYPWIELRCIHRRAHCPAPDAPKKSFIGRNHRETSINRGRHARRNHTRKATGFQVLMSRSFARQNKYLHPRMVEVKPRSRPVGRLYLVREDTRARTLRHLNLGETLIWVTRIHMYQVTRTNMSSTLTHMPTMT
jgi:hypothetical protein